MQATPTSTDDVLKVLTVVGVILSVVSVVVAAVAVAYGTWKTRSDDSWRRTAEGRKARLDDAEGECKRLEQQLREAEDERDRFTKLFLRAQAKVDWYEQRFGSIPPHEGLDR